VQFAASVKILEKTDIGWLGIGCRKRGLKTNEFSTSFALPFWGAYGGGGCPQEYEVDMLAAYHTEYLSPFPKLLMCVFIVVCSKLSLR